MNILLTNDDGYNSIGINILKEKLKKYGTVYEIAPTFHQSGASMSFSINKGFKIIKYDQFSYSIDGTPTDNILLATQLFKDIKFDLLVSGVNNGFNISYDSLYSGTIGACLEGLNQHIPSIAFSTGINNFDIVNNEIENILDYIIFNKLYSDKYCLNINFPLSKFKKSLGLKLTKEVHKKDNFYSFNKDGLIYYDRNESFDTDDVDSDIYAISHGYISICPLKNSYYDEKSYHKLKELIK